MVKILQKKFNNFKLLQIHDALMTTALVGAVTAKLSD